MLHQPNHGRQLAEAAQARRAIDLDRASVRLGGHDAHATGAGPCQRGAGGPDDPPAVAQPPVIGMCAHRLDHAALALAGQPDGDRRHRFSRLVSRQQVEPRTERQSLGHCVPLLDCERRVFERCLLHGDPVYDRLVIARRHLHTCHVDDIGGG